MKAQTELPIAQNGHTYDRPTVFADRPSTIEAVPGSELNSLLADLAARGAWVYALEVEGARYTLKISWRPSS